MTTDSERLIVTLDGLSDELRTITPDLPSGEANSILWAVEMTMPRIRDAVMQGSFITARASDAKSAQKVAGDSLSKAAILAAYGRKRKFSWERRDVASEILIEIMRAQEVLRRTDFFIMPHPDR